MKTYQKGRWPPYDLKNEKFINNQIVEKMKTTQNENYLNTRDKLKNKDNLKLDLVFRFKLNFRKLPVPKLYFLPPKFVFHWRVSSIKIRHPSKVIFHYIFHRRLSPIKVVFYWRLSSIKILEWCAVFISPKNQHLFGNFEYRTSSLQLKRDWNICELKWILVIDDSLDEIKAILNSSQVVVEVEVWVELGKILRRWNNTHFPFQHYQPALYHIVRYAQHTLIPAHSVLYYIECTI